MASLLEQVKKNMQRLQSRIKPAASAAFREAIAPPRQVASVIPKVYKVAKANAIEAFNPMTNVPATFRRTGENLQASAGALKGVLAKSQAQVQKYPTPVRQIAQATQAPTRLSMNLVSDYLGSYGNTLQRVGSGQTNLAATPNPLKQPRKFIASPQFEDVLNASDVVPVAGIAKAGAKSLGIGGKALVKGGKQVAKVASIFDSKGFKSAAKRIPNLQEVVLLTKDDDVALMTDFINSVRNKRVGKYWVKPTKGQDQALENSARYLLDSMNLNPDLPRSKVANLFDEILTYKRKYAKSVTSQGVRPQMGMGLVSSSKTGAETGIRQTLPTQSPLGQKGVPTINQSLTDSIAQDPVQKIVSALKGAKPIRGKQEAVYSQIRSQQAARLAKMGEKVGGEQGYFAQLGQLKGEMPKVSFEGIRNQIKQPEIDSLFDTVEKNNLLSPFEKVTAKAGLAKLLGAEGGVVPTKGELKLLNEVFPPELTQAILDKRPLMQKLFSGAVNALNIPRSLMATADLSAPLRQGIFLVGRPKQWAPAFKEMFKYAFDEKAYKGLMTDIQARPTYKLMRQNKLALTDMGNQLSTREEAFMSTLPEKIPGLGSVVKGSTRAYTGFLNKLRADTFDDMYRSAKQAGLVNENPKLVSDIANFVNTATGRGGLGKFERAAEILNGTLFAPRLVASRVQLLNPQYYVSLDPFVRKEALKSLLSFVGLGATVLGAASLGGAEVGTDPRSSDFGKIKVGNTRYDIWGGFQQYVKLAAQLYTGEIVSSTTGKTMTLGDGYNAMTRKDILLRFFESKESPVASFITSLVQGQTATGEPINLPAEVISRFIPLLAQDMYDQYQERGVAGIGTALPGMFGVGEQTYGKTEYVEGVNQIGQPTSQIRPTQGLPEKIASSVFGEKPLGSTKSFNAETYYNQLQKLPREEAAAQFDQIAKTNPELAKKIVKIVKDRQKGITIKDEQLKAKGVASGDRAVEVYKEFKKLKSNEEKAKLWEDYVRKGVITKEVAEQLTKLLSSEANVRK